MVIGGCIIESFIAKGGMGEMYKARKLNLGCEVALKVLQPSLVEQETVLSRFLREARVAASLTHPSIVKVFDIGEENGLHFIVMEFVQGRDLRDIVNKDGPLGIGPTLRICRQIADALDYAHRRGVIHRDVKPANILLSQEGLAKLTDLGLARPARQDSQVTLTGEILGTPVFMSPEQYRGETVDSRSDLYSLGATMYMLLSGKPPFQCDTAAALVHKVLNERPPSLKALVPSMPEKVVAIVQRLMAKHPIARFQSGRELVAAVNELLVGRFVFAKNEPKNVPKNVQAKPDSAPADFSRLLLWCFLGVLLTTGAYLFWPSLTEIVTGPEAPNRGSSTQAAATSGGGSVTLRTKTSTEIPTKDRDSKGSPTAPGDAKLKPDQPSKPGAEAPGLDSRKPVMIPTQSLISDPALKARIEGFSKCLAGGSTEDALAYFHPSHRNDQGLQFSLARLMDALKSDGVEPGVFVGNQGGPDHASVVLLFRYPEAGRSKGLPAEWVRLDGEWYVRPKSYEATAEQ